MKEITVTYVLSKNEEQRLKKITEECNRQGDCDFSQEDMFDKIMLVGSVHTIDSKFALYESILGIR